jgi:hypothetical protein
MCHCNFHRAIIKFVALKILLERWEDDNRSVTNSTGVTAVTVTSLVTKLYTTQTFVSPILVCWSKRRTPPSGSVYVLIIYGNFIISFCVCISADAKGVVKLRVGTADASLFPAFRTGMSPLVKAHSSEAEQVLVASAINCQNLALDLLGGTRACLYSSKKRRTCRPATPNSYGRLTLHDKTNEPRCVHRLLFQHSNCHSATAPQIGVVSLFGLFLHEGQKRE